MAAPHATADQPSRLGRLGLRLGPAGILLACVLVAATLLPLVALAVLGSPAALAAQPRTLLIGAATAALCILPIAWLWWRLARVESARAQRGDWISDSGLNAPSARHRYVEAAQREWARARRYGEDASLLLVEADHFKALAAEHGAAAGDALMREIARIAQAGLRQPDLMARMALDMIVVLLPHTDPLGALDVAERIRERVAAHRLAWKGIELSTTVSVGVASLGAGHDSLESLRSDADQALAVARQAGRNCVRAAPIRPRTSGENRSVKSR